MLFAGGGWCLFFCARGRAVACAGRAARRAGRAITRVVGGNGDALNRLAGQLFDIFNRFGVFLCDKGKGTAKRTCASSATNAMDIVIGMPRGVKVKDMADPLHIQPAGRDV